MAGFERAQAPGVFEALQSDRRGWRLLPIYAAGLIAGAGLGFGLSPLQPEAATPIARSPLSVVGEATLPDGSTLTTLESAIEYPFPLEGDVYIPPPEAAGIASEVPPVEVATVAVEPEAPAAPPVAVAVPAVVPAPPVAPAVPVPAPAPAPAADTKPNFYVPQARAGATTDLEQRLLDGINRERAAVGLKPYVLDSGLTKVARTRSQQLLDQGYFGHVDPYGYSMYVELLAHFGYSYAWAGENLALNNYSQSESPERALVTLMNSPTHRANILAGDFFRIGVGEVVAADGRIFYTMIFLG